MKRQFTIAVIGLLALAAPVHPAFDAGAAPQAQQPAATPKPPDGKTVVYADFERTENNRPVSARGGLIQLFAYEENAVRKSTFKGLEGANPPAPELVRIKKDDPNLAMKFDYSLLAPNQWAGVTVEIHGLPDVDGKAVPEDVTVFKTLSLQVYATGLRILRLEVISGERGRDMGRQYPQKDFEVRAGMNTYKVPLSTFAQPAWVSDRIDPKEILRQLTSVNLTAFCDQCETNRQGMVIVDNVVFEK